MGLVHDSYNWADYISMDSKLDDFATNDKLAKYIILMTDEAFNTAYAGTNSDDVECEESMLSVTHTGHLCTNIKAAGIKIFTIGFATPIRPTPCSRPAPLRTRER